MEQFKIEEKEYEIWRLQDEIDTFFQNDAKKSPKSLKRSERFIRSLERYSEKPKISSWRTSKWKSTNSQKPKQKQEQ